jgi:AraC family transcriptional regulator of adaptative response / DNA-3-methyladenine glycosylase II
LQDTTLSLTQIAFAAGFGSVRRFNAAFAAAMGSAPSRLRRAHAADEAATPGDDADVGAGAVLTLRLDYRPPYEWTHVLRFLGARAIPGVEAVELDERGGAGGGGAYRRVVREGGAVGTICVRPAAGRAALALEVSPSLVPVLMPLVARVRRLFDLDARPDRIAGVLGRDRTLAPLVAERPGLRVPGALDPFEMAVRALLGQQVSVAAATTLAGRFVAAFGAPYAGGDRLTHRFPTAREVVAAGPDAIARIGLPAARAGGVHALARAVADGVVRLDGAQDLERFVEELVALPGIGPWTAHYLAMRALHQPDAFPAADLGVRKALAARAGAGPELILPSGREAETRAEAWRPFRSYAAIHLWTSLGEPADARPRPDRSGGAANGGAHELDDNDDDRFPPRPAAPRRGRRRTGRRVPTGAGRARGGGGARAGARARRRAARRVLRRRAS